MKNGLTRLFAFILTLALLLSCFSVFVFAEASGDDTAAQNDSVGEDTLVPETEAIVVYNRDFSDGWEVYNGLGNKTSIMKDNNFYIDYEMTVDYNYNYFARYQVLTGNDGFTQLSFPNYPDEKKIFIDFDLKADDYLDPVTDANNPGGILYCRARGNAADGVNVGLLGVKENRLYPFSNKNFESVELKDEWVHVSIVFDYTDLELLADDQFQITVTLGEGENQVSETKTVKALKQYYYGLDFLRFGFAGGIASSKWGMSYCLDNLTAYYNVEEPITKEQIDAQGYGTAVNLEQIKTETILGNGDSDGNTKEHIDNSLAMKLGVNYALLKQERVAIYDGTYGAPLNKNGQIVVPLEIILDYVGYPVYMHEDKKSYDISTGTSAAYITVGRDVATVNGEIVSLNMAPGYQTAENGEQYLVVALDDVETLLPGYYVTYDSMGLIIICQKDNVLNRSSNLTTMLDMMMKFIFDYASPEEVLEDVKETTENFSHPYLLADQERFDKITEVYNEYLEYLDGGDELEYDVDIGYGIWWQVDYAYRLYEVFALPSSTTPVLDENGEQVYKNGDPIMEEQVGEDGETILVQKTDEDSNLLYEQVPVYIENYDSWVGLDWSNSNTQTLIYPHESTNGYDPYGGRQGESTTALSWAQDIAFGYAVTGDIKLAQCVYEILKELGEWNHWGPGHFLNVADAAQRYAIALDWVYNGVLELENSSLLDDDGNAYSTTLLEDLLYKNGVHMGTLSSTKQPHGWTRPQGDVYFYSTMVNNWNSVCTGGMWLASLAILGNEEYQEEASTLISMNLETLIKYGLAQYAPDGSYVESAAYWGYGSNSLFLGMMGLYSSCGTVYGLENTWGFDKTCYFACNIESSDYVMFNYHDASIGQTVDSCSFYFMAEIMNDPVLSEIRKLHNSNGKGFSFRDFLFYPFDSEDSESTVDLPLDYYMEGIDAFTTRSSWDNGALFAGIIGGENAASHGQIDSGTFVYHNAGTVWIMDLGNDEYNTYNYFVTPDRYRYYRNNAEGHNVLALTSQPEDVPHGQVLNASGTIIDWLTNDFGGYAVIDNTAVYGEYAQYAYRGMMLTNDRKTLIVQDEAKMFFAQNLYWFAHFDDSLLDYEISSDKKTMYLMKKDNKNRVTETVRLSIVSARGVETFSVTDCYEESFLLTGDMGTVAPNWSTSKGGVSEKSRASYKRIVVGTGNIAAVDFQLAVVIELIDNRDQAVGYEWTPMEEWEPTTYVSEEDRPGNSVATRGARKLSSIPGNVVRIDQYYNKDTAYGDDIEAVYYTLTELYYVISFFREDYELNKYSEQVEQFDKYQAEFDAFVKATNGLLEARDMLIDGLMGVYEQ